MELGSQDAAREGIGIPHLILFADRAPEKQHEGPYHTYPINQCEQQHQFRSAGHSTFLHI